MTGFRRGRVRPRYRPACEMLEGRLLMTLRPAGLDFVVNNYTVGKQREPDAAVAPDGTTTVVWVDDALDDSGQGIYARRFAPDGHPLGNQFRINTTTAGNQFNPEIAIDGQGSAVIAWVHNTNPGSERPEFYVRAQRLDATGTKVGAEIVATNSLRRNFNIRNPDPHIVFRADGGFSLLFDDQPGTYWNGTNWYNEGDFITQVYSPGGVKQSEVNLDLEPGDGWESYRYLDNMAVDGAGTVLLPTYQRRTRSTFIPDVGESTRYDLRLVIIPLDTQGNRRGPDWPVYQVQDSEDPSTVSLNGAELGTRVPHVFVQTDGSLLIGFQSLDGRYELGRFSASGSQLAPAVPLAGGYVPEVMEMLSDGNLAGLRGTSVPFGDDDMYLSVFAQDGTALDRDLRVTGGFPYIGYRALVAAPGGGAWAFASETTSFTEGEIRARRFVPGQIDPGAIGFEHASLVVGEGQNYLEVALVRTQGSDGAVFVRVVAVTGTAGTGDFNLDGGSGPLVVSFADGETRKTFRVFIINDEIHEEDESFSLSLSDPSGGARLAAERTTTITIVDDDPRPIVPGTLSFRGRPQQQVQEGDTRWTIFVDRAGGSDGSVSVQIRHGTPPPDYLNVPGSPPLLTNPPATYGADYSLSTESLAFADGVTTRSFDILIHEDSSAEGPEYFFLELADPSGRARISGVIRIDFTLLDNDRPQGGGGGSGGGGGGEGEGSTSPAVGVAWVSVRFDGKKKATIVTLSFDGDLSAATASDRASYMIVTAGKDRRIGTKDDKPIRIKSASFAGRTATLTLAGRLPATGALLSSSRLRDIVGRPLDGNRDGLPGGDLAVQLSRRAGTLVSPAPARARARLSSQAGTRDLGRPPLVSDSSGGRYR